MVTMSVDAEAGGYSHDGTRCNVSASYVLSLRVSGSVFHSLFLCSAPTFSIGFVCIAVVTFFVLGHPQIW